MGTDLPPLGGLKEPGSMWTVGEVATWAQLSLSTVYRAIELRDLRAIRLGHSVRIVQEDLIDWVRPYAPADGEWPSRATTSEEPQNDLERDTLNGQHRKECK